jgi:ADP-ribose pyrophosphatase
MINRIVDYSSRMRDSSATLVSRRIVHAGKVLRLELDRVTLPSGHTIDMEIVRHHGSVVLLPVPEPGRIILIRQYRYTVDRWIWELPAGSLKPGEDPDKAASRECHEEIGLVPDRLERLGAYYPTPGYCDELMNFYRATGLRAPGDDERAQQDEDEDIEARPFPLETLRAMIAGREIIDLKTIAGLALIREP